MLDLGFFARLASSGIAALALLLVYHALVDNTNALEAFDELAEDPETFGWAVFLGASSPAVWAAAQRMISDRLAVATTTNEKLRSDMETVRVMLEHAAAQQSPPTAPAGPATLTGPTAQGEPIAVIKDVIGEAAAAQPGDVDVNGLALNLFESLPMAVIPSAPTVSSEQVAQSQETMQQAIGVLNAALTQDPSPGP